MRGWKPATRALQDISMAEAAERLLRQGFNEHDTGDGYALFKRLGTELTASSHKIPLEVALVKEPEGGIEMQLRYDTFVLFDTGDLETEADRIVRTLNH